MRTSRLLTVGHSYIVPLNRRLAHELTRTAPARWEVTVCAPQSLRGDLQSLEIEFEANEPCRTIPIKVRMASRVHFMAYDRKLRDVLAQDWDLVHAWEEPYIYSGSQIARWSAGKPLVYYTYQNISKVYPPPFNWIERSNLRRASGWIAGGVTTEQALIHRPGYADKPHCIIPLGVDVAHFSPDKAARDKIRRKLGWESNDPPVVGYMGRFVAEKGLHIFMQALDRCRTPWRALLLGGGPMQAEIERWATAYPGRVSIVSSVKHHAVPAYLNAMDMLCAPSQTMPHWREQLGRMLTEAFACGVPVIASNSGEIPNVVHTAGMALEETNVEAWATVIEELLNDPVKRRAMSEAGLERAHAEFAWPVVARKHWDFFMQVLDRPAGYSQTHTRPAVPIVLSPEVKRGKHDDLSKLLELTSTNSVPDRSAAAPGPPTEPQEAPSMNEFASRATRPSNARTKPRKLLTIGHSYVLRVNRSLANELQIQSDGRWEVTAIAPHYFHGRNDIRPLKFDADPNEAIRVETVESRLSNRVHFFHYEGRLKSILNDGFDLVHAWEEPYITVGWQIARNTPRDVPLVFRTAQSLDKAYIAPFNWIEKYCVRRMSGWIFSGHLVEQNLLKRPGYASRRRCHAPLGFDPSQIYVDRSLGEHVKQQLGWDDSVPVIGYLGRFVIDKGIAVLIESLRNMNEPWRAMFVGNGPMLIELQQLSADFPGQVALCTNVAHGDVVHYLNAMDVMVAPSLTMPNWREQFGRMIVEAFACGIPVIGSDSGEIPFVIGETGVVVPENNATELQRAIASLINNPRARKEFSDAGMERAHQDYTWANIAKKTLTFFDELTE